LIEKTFSEYPAIVVAPQAPLSNLWITPSTREITEDIVQKIMTDYNVDSNRLYLTGLSMGGFGALLYLNYYTNTSPDIFEFAAVAPMSSGTPSISDLSQVDPWKDTPIWLFHGGQDTAVATELSRNAFRSYTGLAATDPINFNTTALGGEPTAIADNIRYTELDAGHVIWNPIYHEDELYDWMFAQSIPEPASSLLALLALAGLAIFRTPSRWPGSSQAKPTAREIKVSGTEGQGPRDRTTEGQAS